MRSERVVGDVLDRLQRQIERLTHARGVRVAAVRVPSERLETHALELGRDVAVRSALPRALQRVGQVLGDRRERALALERHHAGEHPVEQAAQRIHIRSRVQLFTPRLLGRHVLGGSAHEAGHGDGGALGLDQLRDAEVAHLHTLATLMVGHDHHVLGLEVAVDDPLVVRLLEREEHLMEDRYDAARRERVLLQEELQQIGPVEQLHRQIEHPVARPSEVEDAHGVGVREPAGHSRLPMEALLDLRVGGHVLVEHLHGDLVVEPLLVRRVDDPHGTLAQDCRECVTLGDGLADERVHRLPRIHGHGGAAGDALARLWKVPRAALGTEQGRTLER